MYHKKQINEIHLMDRDGSLTEGHIDSGTALTWHGVIDSVLRSTVDRTQPATIDEDPLVLQVVVDDKGGAGRFSQ